MQRGVRKNLPGDLGPSSSPGLRRGGDQRGGNYVGGGSARGTEKIIPTLMTKRGKRQPGPPEEVLPIVGKGEGAKGQGQIPSEKGRGGGKRVGHRKGTWPKDRKKTVYSRTKREER